MENAVQKVLRVLGGSVTHLANVAGVNPKSAYGWLDKGVVTLPPAAKRLADAQDDVSLEELLFGLNGGDKAKITGTYQGLDPFRLAGPETPEGSELRVSQVA